MDQSLSPISDLRNESVEVSRRLYRNLMETSRQLDDLRSHAKTTCELFSVPAQLLRIKLREIAERLLFSCSLLQRHKVEEILWRKGFYEDVSTSKRLRKENQWLPEERSQLLLHLQCGIGFYHHLILCLQSEFGISSGCVDFPMMFPDQDYGKGKPTPSSKQLHAARDSIHRCLVCLGDLNRYLMDIPSSGNHKLASRYYHQALSWNPEIGMPHNQLGTLSLSTNCNLDAVYHYMRCLMCTQSFEGAEGNLKRSLERNAQKVPQERTVGLGSTFWRCHCLPAGSGHLSEAQDQIQQFLSHFLLLADLWYFDKKPVSNLSDLCHQTLLDFQICLGFTEPNDSNGDTHYFSNPLSKPQENFPSYLTKDMVLKIVVVALICLHRLRSKGSDQVSSLVAFLLAIFCLLIQQVLENFQDSVLNLSLPTVKSCDIGELSCKEKEIELGEEGPKATEDANENGHMNGECLSIMTNGFSGDDCTKKPKKLKRIARRRHKQSTTSDSDEGNDEDCNLSASSDLSEDEEVVLDLSSDEDGELNGRENKGISFADDDADVVILEEVTNSNDVSQSPCLNNGHATSVKKMKLMGQKSASPIDVLEQVAEESLLPAVKVCVDWLLGDKTVIEACGKESFDLIRKFVNLVNAVNIDLEDLKTDPSAQSFLTHYSMIEMKSKIPLPEDALFQKLQFLDKAHENLDWELIRQKCLSSKEEALLRIQRLVQFCKFLETIPETGVEYNNVTQKFSACPKKKLNIDNQSKAPMSPTVDHQRREEIMHNMGQLWLRAEVHNLESSVKRGCKGATFSPYLVLDVDALTKYYQLVGQLTASRKFIMVVPSIVLTALDQLKRESVLARDAIRWLEFQFQKGSRFLRAQTSQEALHLPLVSYPKQKSREAW
ncbi:Protein SMG5 [Frankliniella fusca]|uniref:Protein SMG5 n=1 Tax=Frankliniella fusca TaxID=407009 RepID=A0AAE1GZS3_9NEOP|nr:Protein SMG5 [Frankliniella fusca]